VIIIYRPWTISMTNTCAQSSLISVLVDLSGRCRQPIVSAPYVLGAFSRTFLDIRKARIVVQTRNRVENARRFHTQTRRTSIAAADERIASFSTMWFCYYTVRHNYGTGFYPDIFFGGKLPPNFETPPPKKTFWPGL